MIKKSTNYGLALNGVLIAKGNAKEMRKAFKATGRSKAGYQVWITDRPIDSVMTPRAVLDFEEIRKPVRT